MGRISSLWCWSFLVEDNGVTLSRKGLPWCFWGGITGEKAGVRITSGALSWSHGWKAQSLDGAQPHCRLHCLSAAGVTKTLNAVAPTCSRVSNPSASGGPSSGLSPDPLELQTFQRNGHSRRSTVHADISLPAWVVSHRLGLAWLLPPAGSSVQSISLLFGPLGCHVAPCTEVCVSLVRCRSKSVWLLLLALGCQEGFLYLTVI